MTINHLFPFYRVEARGNVSITDVIYSSKTNSEQEQLSSPGSREEYERLKVGKKVYTGDL